MKDQLTSNLVAWRKIPCGVYAVPAPALLWQSQCGGYIVFQPEQSNYMTPGITHWMPLPEPPNGRD